MISMKKKTKQKKNRSVDNNNAGIILLKKVTFVRTMIKSKAKLGIVFIIYVTTCDTIYIIVVNINAKRKTVLNNGMRVL